MAGVLRDCSGAQDAATYGTVTDYDVSSHYQAVEHSDAATKLPQFDVKLLDRRQLHREVGQPCRLDPCGKGMRSVPA